VTAALDEARQRLDDFDASEESVLRATTDVGFRSARFTALSDRLTGLSIGVAEKRSAIQDTDFAEYLVKLKEQEAVYQSSLQITARLSQISLSNFLR
jgi:flagellar hook-associated protein 3 FlgL